MLDVLYDGQIATCHVALLICPHYYYYYYYFIQDRNSTLV